MTSINPSYSAAFSFHARDEFPPDEHLIPKQSSGLTLKKPNLETIEEYDAEGNLVCIIRDRKTKVVVERKILKRVNKTMKNARKQIFKFNPEKRVSQNNGTSTKQWWA